jgi:hypothetical protein
MIKSEAEIYQIMEQLLRKAGDKPQTCVDLYDDARVKKHADSPNRVSDYLGHMWRRGLVQRWYAAKDTKTRTRYAYTWIDQDTLAPEPVDRLTVVRNPSKPNVTVTESDGSVTLDFKEFTITVVRK